MVDVANQGQTSSNIFSQKPNLCDVNDEKHHLFDLSILDQNWLFNWVVRVQSRQFLCNLLKLDNQGIFYLWVNNFQDKIRQTNVHVAINSVSLRCLFTFAKIRKQNFVKIFDIFSISQQTPSKTMHPIKKLLALYEI